MLLYLWCFNLLVDLVRSPRYEGENLRVKSGLYLFLDLFVANYGFHSTV